MHRRLEDRIKALCAKLIATADTPEWKEILQQLKTTLHQHSRRTRALVAEFPMRTERRSAD